MIPTTQTIIISGILSIISIAIGWSLKEWSDYKKIVGEEKKIAKEVLFQLLNVWHYVNTYKKILNIDFIGKLSNIIKSLMLNNMPPNTPIEMIEENVKEIAKQYEDSGLIQILIPQLINKLMPDSKEIEKEYNQSIKKLSTIDPLISYYLDNQVKLFDYINEFTPTIEQSALQANLLKTPFTNQEKTILEQTIYNPTKKQFLQKQLDEFEGHIKNIAKLINKKVEKDIEVLLETGKKNLLNKCKTLYNN